EVCVLDQDGTELAHFRIPHTCHGLETLKKQLLRYVTSPEEAPCFLETSQGLLVQFLLEAGFPVYPLNPKVVDYRRKPSGAKSDT
ncbi:IS110 family transposase, partial [Ammonifex thiophilus]